MAYNNYDIGDLVKVTGTFTDPVDDTPNDPDVVKVSIQKPDGTLTTYIYGTDAEVIKLSTGIYYMHVDADQSGTWYYRWWSTGQGQASEETAFEIDSAETI